MYSMYDRMVTIGVMPLKEAIKLPVYEDLTKAAYFLERRELGIINTGGEGVVVVDGVFHPRQQGMSYVGKGKKRSLLQAAMLPRQQNSL